MPDPTETPVEDRRPRKWARWRWGVRLGVLTLLILVGGAALFLVRSGRGQRIVLEQALAQVRGVFAGSLTVETIRSPNLLEGATLVGVRLDAGQGQPFLHVDSLHLRYSIFGLVAGRPRIASVTVWGPHVEVSRYPGQEESNVSHLLRPSGPVTDSTTSVREILVGRIRVRGGGLEILSPLDSAPSSRIRTMPAPGGQGELRSIALDSLDADLGDVLLRFGGTTPFTGTVTSLSFDAGVFREPAEIVDARGRLSYGVGGLDFQNATIRLPSSTLKGEVRLGPETGEGSSWALAMNLRTQGQGSLDDIHWVDPRIPDGSFTGGVSVTAGTTLGVRFHQLAVDLDASRLTLDGGVDFGSQTRLDDLTVETRPLLVSRLEPWLDRELPLDGWLTGSMTLSGTPGSLSTNGRMTLVPVGYGSAPSTADFRGVLHAGTDPGATNLELRLEPLNFGILEVLAPGLSIPGAGRATLSLSGRVDSGIRMVLDVRANQDSASHVTLHGSFTRHGGGRWTTDMQSELAPLSLGLLASLQPRLKLGGTLRGSLRAVGPLDTLHVTGSLSGAGGDATLDGTVDARNVGARYRMDANLAGVRVSDLVALAPAPTSWSGRVQVEGRGLSPDSVEATATVEVGGSRIGGLHLDTVMARVRASGGLLAIDTLSANLGGVHVDGSGRLGLIQAVEGEADFSFSSDSLLGLRSLFMGDTVVARDTLSALERELLRFQGVNPDALPDSADVSMSGTLAGRAHVAGSLEALDVDATAVLRSGVYRRNRVDSISANVTARGLRSSSDTLRFSVDAGGLDAFDRTFQQVHVEGNVSRGEGEAAVRIRRRQGEVYAAAGSFALDSLGGTVDLRQASATFDSVSWRMPNPTRIAWDSSSVSIDSLHVTRADQEPMNVLVSGTLSRTGRSDFHLDASGVRLTRLARMAQLESLGIGGHVDLTVDVTGPAADPVIRSSLEVQDPRYGELAMTRVSGEIVYENRAANVQLDAWNDARKALTVAGTVPIDLALTNEPRRKLPIPMDVRVQADSLDASVALSYFTMLEDVKGTVSGDFRVRGTLDRPEPSGSLRLQDAAWSIESIGVRHTGVHGSLTLEPDRTVVVNLDASATGTSEVTGKVTLEPVSDPKLDLKIHFAGFQAVNRRDVAGRISGDLTLTDSYRRPKVDGSLTVDQGTLSLEEFARSSDVVDLSDPDVFNVVDTTMLSTRPNLANLRNPFLDNLRVDVDLSVPRDTWLRSQDMNVEIGGDLKVVYDRLKRELVMVGDLNALRGSYSVLGRRFDVQSGTVGFIGTPGINPTLNIQAVSHIRRVGSDPLNVTATVSGTLTDPRVSLSTDEQGVAQSDLVSYLVFGRPAHELSSGQSALVQGAVGGGVNWVVGSLATRISSAVAQEFGVDYLSISQGTDVQAGNVGVFAAPVQGILNSQLEIGQYLSRNVFVVVVLRRPGEGGSSASWLGGARVEWALSDNYNAEGFVEDRFLRSRSPGFGELGQNSQVLGVFIYREWGY